MAHKSPKIELSPDFLDFIRLSNENSLETLPVTLSVRDLYLKVDGQKE